ncbi:MAG: hypothetical protein JWM21_2781 [Acidobacteria bacterium]|nr:hypothetical protein [Acidobacteriota bacterium]
MSTWQFQTQEFLLPKSGHQLSECEDAIGINLPAGRFAVADGATEAFDSQSWAQLLAHDWVLQGPVDQTIDEFRAWLARVGQSLHDSWSGLRLSWYAEEKAATGSFAAFVGVQFEKLEGAAHGWRAIAVGDSCLVQCRHNKIVSALPLSRYQDFNATPPLMPSHPSMQAAALEKVVIAAGTIEHGDVLLLFSDAVAAWYLMMAEKDEQARLRFDLLLKTRQESELQLLFEKDRLNGRIKDDDIAVIRIEVSPE